MTVLNKIFNAELPKSGMMNFILLGFRLLIALSMINTHGMKKITDIKGTIAHIPDPFGMGGEISTYIAIGANIFLAAFVALGFATRLSAFGILTVTLSGFFIVHGNDPWPVRDVPLMYSLAFMLILFTGPGTISLDQLISRKLK